MRPPSQVGNRSSSLVFTSNDPDSPFGLPLAGRGIAPPEIAFRPARLEGTRKPGTQKTLDLQICNTGEGLLQYSIEPIITAAALAEPGGRPTTAVGGLAIAVADRAAFERRATAMPVSGAASNASAGSHIGGSASPGTFGYSWIDSDSPGGPAFEWVDIRATGTPIPFPAMADDGTVGSLPIGFSFPYCGGSFDRFQASPSGWVSFTSTQSSGVNGQLPDAAAPENLLAAYWDDLVYFTGFGSQAFYGRDGERLVIQFDNLWPRQQPYPSFVQLEIQLYPSGRIVFAYRKAGSMPTTATVGIQNGTRDRGLTPGSGHLEKKSRTANCPG